MHDPLVVVWDIRRPWPTVTRTRRRHGRQIGWHAFWHLGPWELYFPSLVTIWHREPDDRDSGTVCKYPTHKRHPHHWRIQVPPLQDLRRRLLTRCEWCGGRSRKRDCVNHSAQWDRKRGPWWRGASGLFHSGCMTMWLAHSRCLCDRPDFEHGDYGRCQTCEKFRGWRQTPTDLDHAMAALRAGTRMPQWISDEFTRRRRAADEVVPDA